MSKQRCILVIEDEPVIQHWLQALLTSANYPVVIAGDGAAALKILAQPDLHLDAIILDRKLPDTDGLALLLKIKSHADLKMLPVIIHSSLSDKQDILAGIRAGAYYYLPKPSTPELLLSVVRTAIKDKHQYDELHVLLKQDDQALALLQTGQFTFRTLPQCTALAGLLAKACPDPAKIAYGLSELLINAVEHGNLGISFAEKSVLLQEGRWQNEIEKRLQLPAYSHHASIAFNRNEQEIHFTIKDAGTGFDSQQFATLDPGQLFTATHGRGITIAKTLSFDAVTYVGCGNEVHCVVKM